MSEGPQSERQRPMLRIFWILRLVVRMYRRRWKLLVPLSVLILFPQALADAAIGDVDIERVHTAADVLKVAAIPLSVAINLGGEALYAGIVAAGVVEWMAGRELTDLRATARTIAYGRLIAIDLILAIGTSVGLVLLVIPGVLFYTYQAVSPALIEIQGSSIRDAMRDSFRLVRGSFWRVLGYSVFVLVASGGIASALHSPLDGVTGNLIWNLGVEALLEPFVGLTTVLLALALLELHGEDDRLSRWAERTGPRL